jgi:hypothetical protein
MVQTTHQRRAVLLYRLPPHSSDGVSLPLEVGFLNTKTVSEAYSGKPLPSHVAMLVGSSVTCRKTGQSFVLEDINKLYLTPVLEPLLRDSKRA